VRATAEEDYEQIIGVLTAARRAVNGYQCRTFTVHGITEAF
jgi:hypothetical protein